MSARRDTVWYVRERGGTVKHREGGNIQGDNKTTDTMTILQGGSHSEVYDGVLEVDSQFGAINSMYLAVDQSYRTPDPRV